MRILVVEDEERLALLLRRILTGERHTVDLAYDGISGRDLALNGRGKFSRSSQTADDIRADEFSSTAAAERRGAEARAIVQ